MNFFWLVTLIVLSWSATVADCWADETQLSANVIASFESMHDGWSSDEVVLQDKLWQAFIGHCRSLNANADSFECCWKLLNLRKAGKLQSIKVTKRGHARHDAYRHLAEMAARTMEDKHAANMDRVVCDPDLRAEFDAISQRFAPGLEPYLVRKAAFGLRKARRLRPELITRIADWNREVVSHSVASLQLDLTLAPTNPGIYIFRGKSGYLYVGESNNLRRRLSEHLDKSNPVALIHMIMEDDQVQLNSVEVELHSFDPDSRAKETRVRRAYESQLIDSRKPRFNIRP